MPPRAKDFITRLHETKLSDYLVALSVIACSIVLLAALTVALSGYRLKKSERTLQIDYEDVTASRFIPKFVTRARRPDA